MSTLLSKPTQCSRILDVFKLRPGEWINGRYFNDTMRISQFHARIWQLQEQGHRIKASDFKDEYGFKSYKYLAPDAQETLF